MYSRFLLLILITLFSLTFTITSTFGWGFYAHQQINRLAIFTLPPEMIVFYKANIDYITTNAVAPDKRRYTSKDEACRHYIDLNVYHDSLRNKMPMFWHQAKAIFPEDTLKKHGIVPWHVYLMKVRLTEAFKQKDKAAILKLSADLGHYIADAHVPLHTTNNYNGQFTAQHGIHGLWESRIPELYAQQYDVWAGAAQYLNVPQKDIWETVYASHACLKEVFALEKEASAEIPEDRKFSFEDRNGQMVRVYSKEFTKQYNDKLHGQIEGRFLASIRLLGNMWFTCWVDAGQPDLNSLVTQKMLAKIEEIPKQDSAAVHDCNQNFHE